MLILMMILMMIVMMIIYLRIARRARIRDRVFLIQIGWLGSPPSIRPPKHILFEKDCLASSTVDEVFVVRVMMVWVGGGAAPAAVFLIFVFSKNNEHN